MGTTQNEISITRQSIRSIDERAASEKLEIIRLQASGMGDKPACMAWGAARDPRPPDLRQPLDNGQIRRCV
jgi:hypothetical protein